jgi:hypothetical protein
MEILKIEKMGEGPRNEMNLLMRRNKRKEIGTNSICRSIVSKTRAHLHSRTH